jgi:homospermidine synthase
MGSRLSASQADEIIPGASATSVQVVAGVIAAAIMALDEPLRGLLEPEALDHAKALQLCAPYLGPMVTVHADWYPTGERQGFQFPDFLAAEPAAQARDLSPS